MTKNVPLAIKAVKTEMDTERVLDLWGQDFRFDHPKGIAEWIKNSIDAYRRMDIADAKQYIVLTVDDDFFGEPAISCIDFVGTTKAHIEADFKKWGSAAAAGGGTGKKTYGGHGNGGKFYMRQMFKHSDFITYKDGKLNVFGFNENRRYGFADGYVDKKMSYQDALRFARVENDFIPESVMTMLREGTTGFTVVRGYGPAPTPGKRAGSLPADKYCERLRNHPQLMRALSRMNLTVFRNGYCLFSKLAPDELPSYAGFDEPLLIEVPETLPYAFMDGAGTTTVGTGKYKAGALILHTSDVALEGPKYSELNRIDILGGVGVIASYPLQKLRVRNFPQASHVWGELKDCEILESDDHDCVKNDRIELADNELTRAILSWVTEQVDALALKLADQQRKESEEVQKKISTRYNEYLNAWKDKLMKKVIGEVLGSEKPGKDVGGSERGRKRNTLVAPEEAIEYAFPSANIPLNQEYPLTLKALCPDKIPAGGIVEFSSTNPLIEPKTVSYTIDADSIKESVDGKSVAVFNIMVVGTRVNEEGKLIAKSGPYSATIDLTVIRANEPTKDKGQKSQTVLLSGHDKDPLGLVPGSLILSPREYVVYQRKQDSAEGIYWINTANPMAKKIFEKYNADSLQWRSFLFNRYLEIFQKDLLFELEKREPDNFNASNIDVRTSELLRKILTLAADDLGAFLTDDKYQIEQGQSVEQGADL